MNKSYLKKDSFLKILSSSLVYLPSPINISLWWNLGSLLGVCLFMQFISGLFLSMHYTSNISYSFMSIIHIIQDVNLGWLMRLIHMNVASLFFMCVYIHIGRGVYYGSFYKSNVWFLGILILLLMMASAFLGYVLPWGQMSFWGATVITNLISTIPYLGEMLVTWLWGGFSVENPTLNRFYTLHFLMPFVLMIFVFLHLMYLHINGSMNPLGFKSDFYKIIFSKFYTLKDFMSLIYLCLILIFIVTEYPYFLGDSENFIEANCMVTPVHIQPEWYFLFAYTILRAIPNKLGGFLALLSSILILGILPFMKKSKFQSMSFYPLNQLFFFMFLNLFLILTWLGSKPIEVPFVMISQILTIWYFSYFINLMNMKLFWDKFLYN